MTDAEKTDPAKAVAQLLADKQALAAREKAMIEELDAALQTIGYKIVPLDGANGSVARPVRKRGRPPGSGKPDAPNLPH